MKAVVIHAPGAAEQLVIADVPEPMPSPGEVLVDVAFAGCNWADTQERTGIYPHPRSYPLVPGIEISGTVSKLGPDISGVRVGDRVAAFLEQGGAYAETVVVRANMLMPLPAEIPFDVGAALTVQPLTGYHMLHTIHGVEPGEIVLINAIGGGVGLFTTQLAVKASVRVFGTVGTPGKEKRALEYGAERVVVTTNEDFERAVLNSPTAAASISQSIHWARQCSTVLSPWYARWGISSASGRRKASRLIIFANASCRVLKPLPAFRLVMSTPTPRRGRIACRTLCAALSKGG